MNEENTSLMVREEEPVLTLVELRAKVNLVAQVMRDVMKEGVHYGTIPGTPKPSLYKPGAEKLSMTFGIAVTTEIIEDRVEKDEVTYFVKATATSQHTGRFLGAKLGVCSTEEEKYRWRKPIGGEFAETPEDRRRLKWKKGSGTSTFQEPQVRQDVGSVRNTILQMADKRATVAVIRQVTAASDIFTQDVEDIPEEAREAATENGQEPMKQPQRSSAQAAAPAQGAPAAAQAPIETEAADPNSPMPWQAPNGTLLPLTVLAVKKAKSGTNGRGSWTLWIVTTDKGEFSSFSSTDAGLAEKARANNQKVFIRAELNDKGAAIAEITIQAQAVA